MKRYALVLVLSMSSMCLAAQADDFDIGSFVDSVLTATNDDWRYDTYDAVIQVKDAQNRSFEGKTFQLDPGRREGARKIMGKVGEGNLIKAEGLVSSGLDERSGRYTVKIDGKHVGRLTKQAAMNQEPVIMFMPVSVGDAAPEFSVKNITDDTELKLSDLRGEFVFIDFWTTWCGPCQDPMAKNNTIMQRKAVEWEGRARILGVSLDKTREALEEHIKKKGWTHVQHTWAGGWTGQEVPEKYQVRSVPTGILVDPDGIIIWRGHPGRVDIEEMIEEYLADRDAA